MNSLSFLIEKIKLFPFPAIILPFSRDYHEIGVNPPKITPFSEFLAIVNVGPLSSHFK